MNSKQLSDKKQSSYKKQSTDKKQSMEQVMKNNLFLFKICFSAAPLCCIMFIMEAIRNELVIFLEFTFGLNYVLECAEYGKPFKDAFLFMAGLFTFVCLGLLFNSILYQKVQVKAMFVIKKKLRDILYQKAKEIDLECYDNPEYYNDFILSISEADRQIDRTFDFISKICTALTSFITVGLFYISKDAISLLFIVTPAILSFFMAQTYNKINYKNRLEKNPQERKRSYISRVFYLNEYAKEIRLNPEISDIMLNQFDDLNDSLYKIDLKYTKKKMIISFVRSFICNNFFSNVLYITYLVYKAAILKDISYSNVVVLFNSSERFRYRLNIFTELYPFASETSLYVDKIKAFLTLEPSILSRKNLPVPTKPKKLVFKHVSFAYHKEEKNVLSDISLTIEPCKKVALVGYNGAGKTTLIKLIMRLYDTSDGEIMLDGVNIKDYDVNDYRDGIGAVFQDYKLYAATVRENVLLDYPENADEERLHDALKKSAFAKRLNTMEHGLDTNLTTEFEDDGVNLSGGEGQKVAISRVFYNKCGLIILDEPSSALDPIAEYQLNDSMREAARHKTVIFISHRLSTTRLADKIFMLEDGQIIEEGSHDELLKKNGKYAQMWKAQAGQYLTA